MKQTLEYQLQKLMCKIATKHAKRLKCYIEDSRDGSEFRRAYDLKLINLTKSMSYHLVFKGDFEKDSLTGHVIRKEIEVKIVPNHRVTIVFYTWHSTRTSIFNDSYAISFDNNANFLTFSMQHPHNMGPALKLLKEIESGVELIKSKLL